ncbi:MAG TPA: DUF4190 domain-containing protein [Candidatus Acidoferrales bacterium]|nr:DUF4190 domain-containing protein [Candidatus Acidoferrales bacterium]
MECPNCKRTNPDDAVKCECGYLITANSGPTTVRRRNNFAIASFVCGLAVVLVPILFNAATQDVGRPLNLDPERASVAPQIVAESFKILIAVAAIILGWEGGARVRETGGGRGLAITGIVLGFIQVLASGEVIATLLRSS